MVFCTTYALILPAITMESSECEIPEHTHTQECYTQVTSTTRKELTCGKEEHTHSAECQGTSDLTAEEQAQVDEVIALIDALPTSEEVEEKLTAYDDAGDEEGRKTYLTECCQQVQDAKKAYTDLTDAQKEKVTNADKLKELEWLLDEPAGSDASVLTDDSAYVSELTVTGAEVTGDDTATSVGTMSVHNGDTITYSVLVQTASYTDSDFDEGRVKLEFVLPLSEKQAAFDLSAMTWLDSSEGYAPTTTEQVRVVDGKEVQCQVLTGYKLLRSQEQGSSAIPGEFTGTVPVKVLDMAQGEGIALQISAAMEYGVWDGQCETHLIEEKLTVATDTYTVTATLSAEEQQAIYEQFLAEVEELEAYGKLDDSAREKAEDLLRRLQEAYQQGQLTEEGYTELYNRVYTFLYGDVNTIAEAAEGTNWILLRDSGWFEEYSNSASSTVQAQQKVTAASRSSRLASVEDGTDTAEQPSDVQVDDQGGSVKSADGSVSVSKTISGTDLENVFDITLQVQTSRNVSEISTEPDMAVVIVMDISNTMNSNFGDVTRYAAAMNAAEDFLDKFAEQNSQGISKVGYVAFNTDAHQIFGLQPCANAKQANALKNTMRTQTGSIINDADYNNSHSRFTNVEAGLAMAADMLNGASNKNKFIIFLSDGFPTTYISSGYSGYDPYDSKGIRFNDDVLKKPCTYGTSYSNEAAIRARNKAAKIKESGVTIFSIGVDVAGQTIQTYITQSENAKGFSVVDRTDTTYEIGDASSTEAYKNWLKEKIGSGYYYDSTDSSGLASAYDQIFEKIKQTVEAGSAADWVASDPIPTAGGAVENVEFIAFYDKNTALDSGPLLGENVPNGENTVSFDTEKYAINWDLKKSGYTAQSDNSGTTIYTYTLVYRVRLKNENAGFTEGTVYPTNDTTTLQYRTIEGTDGNLTVSAPKTVKFPIPSVHGYLAKLTFTKVDSSGKVLPGAEFTLSHDTKECGTCRGDGKTSVEIQDKTAISDAEGTVTFTNIPSGHKYTLTETKVPDGYSANGNTYTVKVAYDEITVTVRTKDGASEDWNSEIKNTVYYELPKTGGPGTLLYTCSGLGLMLASVLMYRMLRKRREEM